MEIQRYIGENSISLTRWNEVSYYLDGCNLPAKTASAALQAGISPDALSKGQLCSKFWLRDVATAYSLLRNKHVVVCGGWYGILSAIILNEFDVTSITSMDIDPMCQDIAYKLIDNESFYAVTDDMYDYEYSDYDFVINTSFEHLYDYHRWLEALNNHKGRIAVQSNNFFSSDQHVNCVNSVEELQEQLGFSKTIYAGTLKLPMYERYMVIGEL